MDSIYSLTLAQSDLGLHVSHKAPPAAAVVQDGFPASDAWRYRREPSDLELIRENLGTAYACAQLNAQAVAKTPLRLYVVTRRGEPAPKLRGMGWTSPASESAIARMKAEPSMTGRTSTASEVEQVTRHPVLDLLDHPIPGQPHLMNRHSLMLCVQLYKEIVGRSYIYMPKNRLGRPAELWLLASHLVQEKSQNGTLVDGYEFGNSAQRQSYAVDEVLRFRYPSPFNPYIGGMSPLRACLDQIRIRRSTDAHVQATVDNGARPGSVISPTRAEDGFTMGPDEARRLENKVNSRFRMAGAGATLVWDSPLNVQMLQWPINDIIDLGRLELTKEDVANAYGVPDAKLRRNAANLSSAETADYAHAVDAVLPRCLALQEELNASLLPYYDPSGRLFFMYDDPVPENRDMAIREEEMMLRTGAINRNEQRRRRGMSPVDGGDRYLVQQQMTALDDSTGAPIRDGRSLNISDAIAASPLVDQIEALKIMGYSESEARAIVDRRRADTGLVEQ